MYKSLLIKLRTYSIEKYFLTLSIIFGVLFVFITPPYQTPDEYNHFFRAYEISNGSLISRNISKSDIDNSINIFPGMEERASNYLVGDYMPVGLVNTMEEVSNDLIGKTSHKQSLYEIKKLLMEKPDYSSEVFVNFPNTALYSPISYFPQVIGILFSKLINLSFLGMLYVSRLTNLSVYIYLIFKSIKYVPLMKKTLLMIVLMPTTLFIASSASADALLFGISFLLFSLVLKIKNDTKYDKKTYYYILALSLLLGFIKSAYFLLPLAYLINIKSKKFNIILSAFAPTILSIFAVGIWSYFSKNLIIPLRVGVDHYGQLNNIINNPLSFINILINTLIGHRKYILTQIVGNLGWLDTPLNYLFVIVYLILTIFCVIFSDSKEVVNKYTKVVFISLTVVTTFIVSAMIYMSWSPVGSSVILGLVGKNFVPLLPYGLILFIWKPIKKFARVLNILIYAFIPISLFYSLYELVSRFYLN